MSKTVPKTCPQCGKPLPADAPGGLCPNCVMAMNLSPETRTSTADSAAKQAPPSPEEMAARFPNFEIIECLGRGGMGVVYKARQKALDREVAIKVLAGEWQDEPEFAERFEREAKTLAQLSHSNIVTVHDFGEADGLYYLVMEYVDGVNLRDLLTDGKLEANQALAIVPPICEGLEYAHGKGVVHRDIKPENLLLDRDGRVKIADFGIASLVGAKSESSGTPSYMAPEQNSGRADRRADIYSLGVVLYEMLTGERPGKNLVALSRKVEVDVKIDEMVLRALEKDPERRYQTAREFQTTAELAMSTPTSALHDGATPRPSRTVQRGWKSPASGWGWFIGKLFGCTFTSPTAYKVANLSALGFLGCLGFLGHIHQIAFAKSLFGLFGLFGLIGIAFMIELPQRMSDVLQPKEKSSGDNPPGAAASPWPRRVFWLLGTVVITTPLLLFASMLGVQAARLGVTNAEAALWMTSAAVLVILAFAPPVMFLLSLRRLPEDAANPWVRRIALLLVAIPAVLLGMFVLVLIPVWMANRMDSDLQNSALVEPQAAAEPQRDVFLGSWLWEEAHSGDKVWLAISAARTGSMHGTNLGGQLQFHNHLKWTVKEGKIEATFGVGKATGELSKDGNSLTMQLIRDGRNVLFQKSDKSPSALSTDLVIVEDLALQMIVAIREQDNGKLKSLATDRINNWPDALPLFATELRERYRQITGNKDFDLRATESMVKRDLASVRCTGPEVLEGKCLILSFIKTPDGWKNCLLKNSTENVELREHLSELERQLDAGQSN